MKTANDETSQHDGLWSKHKKKTANNDKSQLNGFWREEESRPELRQNLLLEV
jgi:hypothetical protein